MSPAVFLYFSVPFLPNLNQKGIIHLVLYQALMQLSQGLVKLTRFRCFPLIQKFSATRVCDYQSTSVQASSVTSSLFILLFRQSTYIGRVGAHQCHLGIENFIRMKRFILQTFHAKSILYGCIFDIITPFVLVYSFRVRNVYTLPNLQKKY